MGLFYGFYYNYMKIKKLNTLKMKINIIFIFKDFFGLKSMPQKVVFEA